MTSRRVVVLAAAALVAGLFGGAPTSVATFVDADTATGAFTTAQLYPPTELAGTGGPSVTLTWTPTVSTRAEGYEILRSSTPGSGYAVVGTVAPVTGTSAIDAPAPGTWYYVVRSTFGGWASPPGNEVAVTVVAQTVTTPIAYCDPGKNRAETSGAGDNNGFEVNPGNACLPDGLVALDKDSGTSNVNSCLAATKDKHQFWGHELSLPTAIAAVNGITVTARASQSSNGGTAWLCMQLSSDSGLTWTVPRVVTMTGRTLATYTFGGPAEDWGRSWTLGDLGSGFRVRVIPSSTQSPKDFGLDALGVAVTYAPAGVPAPVAPAPLTAPAPAIAPAPVVTPAPMVTPVPARLSAPKGESLVPIQLAEPAPSPSPASSAAPSASATPAPSDSPTPTAGSSVPDASAAPTGSATPSQQPVATETPAP